MKEKKIRIKFTIILGIMLLCICVFKTTVNATNNEEILNIIPNTISIDIPEIEYNKAQASIENKVKEIIASSDLEDKDTLNVSVDYNIFYFYEATVNVGSVRKEVNISFNNTNNVNKEDEQYIKNLKIENPKYIETDLNYLVVNNQPWNYCGKKLNEYFTNKVNYNNIKCTAIIGQGAGNGINLGATDTYLYVFKNGKLYDIKHFENITFIPVVNVPACVTDKELNDYVVKEVNKIYKYDEYGYASITKKSNDIYTINSENELKDYYTCEIRIKREKVLTKNIVNMTISNIKDQNYNGTTLKPSITIKDGNNILKNNLDYTLSYKNNINIGEASITINGKGKYTGSKTISFNIIPSQVNKLKAKSQKEKEITLKWSKNGGNVTGYKIYKYNSKTKKYDYVVKTKNTKYTIKNLKIGTTYKFRVKAYKTVDKEEYTGKETELSASTNPSKTKITKLTTKNKKATIKWKKISNATGYEIYMSKNKNKGYKKIKNITKKNTIRYKKGSLKKNKTFYFKIRTYRTVDGKKVYSSYSSVKNVRIK